MDYGLFYKGFGIEQSAINDSDYPGEKMGRASKTGYVTSVAKSFID